MNLNKIIDNKFSSSFMNDSKWDKLMECLTDKFNEIFVNFKLVHSDEIKNTSFITTDFKPFFIEPILYKEIEWIQFPSEYEITKNKRTTRKLTKSQTQDIHQIEKEINSLGVFELEINKSDLKLYAYK
ncbi:DUF6678 family protein [Tenacibaculum ovolyticum]|uniref:DUF6678 family protein n=1 Tax=Tenacibaculum ovolyticum TaxID=104270 RepID=UPI003BA9C03F